MNASRLHPDLNVASIPPGAPFLPTLVDALLDGRLVDGFAPGDDPLALSAVTIWVPTRRAARALATQFVTRFDGEAALLPAIRALGDTDDETLTLAETDEELALTPVIGGMERKLVLARLISRWAGSLNPEQRSLYDGADIVVPSSTADAVRFAADLAELMDTVATEEADWGKLREIEAGGIARWWQLTLDFLAIATTAWPKILEERGLTENAVLRSHALRRRAEAYRKADADGMLPGPVIAAGSTGSIPATADLLKTIANLRQGALVLPALDRDLSDEIWTKVDVPDNERDDHGAAPGHPQYGLKRLLSELKIDRSEVRQLGTIADASEGPMRVRETLVSEALKPSAFTDEWQDSFANLDAAKRKSAFGGVSLVEAVGEREEALAIALALRETLEDKRKTAALVTPDRNLARRVAVEMRRFGVAVDDSGGVPLRNRAQGDFVRLVAETAFGDGGAVALAALMKHPLARFGEKTEIVRTAARVLELSVLRGNPVTPKLASLPTLLSGARNRAAEDKRHTAEAILRLSDTDWQQAEWLAQRLAEIFTADASDTSPFQEIAHRTVALVEACGADEQGDLANLYDKEEGRALNAFLVDLLDQSEDIHVPPREWPAILDALMEGRNVRPVGGTHPRVTILGPIEARLQTFDRVVLGGLNEGTWPAPTRNDPFLSRPMRATLGLPAPERRTGLAAHDFQTILGMEDVVLTRSTKVGNAPAVASRWVQRLLMAAGETASDAMRKRGSKFTDWLTQIDEPDARPNPTTQPRPAPPVELRPNSLSITEIETWIQDPYAIYARHILELEALDPLKYEAGIKERGTLYHAIMEKFMKSVNADPSNGTLDHLMKVARVEFDALHVADDLRTLWWPRFRTVAEAFIAWHLEDAAAEKHRFIEIKGRTDDDLDGFTLRGRADRIDIDDDGGLTVIDYKTGLTPYLSDVRALDAPQLPLTAAMAQRGAFGPDAEGKPERLAYVRLRPVETLQVDEITAGNPDKNIPGAAELADASWDKLKGLIAAYRDASKSYESKAKPGLQRYESDYDHLARVREWSVAGEGDET